MLSGRIVSSPLAVTSEDLISMKSEPKSVWRELVDYVKRVVRFEDARPTGRRDRRQDADDEGRRIGFPDKLPAFARIPR